MLFGASGKIIQRTRCDRRWGLLIFFMGGLALGCLWPEAHAAERLNLSSQLEELGYETVSLRRTGQNHWFLFAQVEGRKRSCLVDTGWSFTTVATNITGPLPGTSLVRTLKLGGLTLTNVPAQGNDLRVNGQPTAYTMVLGCDFLVRSQAILDCGNNKLYLRPDSKPAASFTELETQLSRAGWISITLQERQPPALTCAARINDRPTELLVDSGAMWSCLDQTFATTAGVRTSASLQRMTGPGAERQRTYRIASLNSWSLGTTPMSECNFAVLALTDWGLGKGGKLFPEVNGILGGAELKAGAALIDCGNRKLWLRHKR